MKRLLIFALCYLMLLCIPLLMSWVLPNSQDLPPRPLRDDLASGLAMVGFTAVLLEFFLLGRFRPISRALGSDLAMQAHQLLARTALVFLVLHPLLYSLWGSAQKPWDDSYVQALRISGGSWGLFTGLLALALLMSLVAMALGQARSRDYDRWRLWHGLLALGVLGLGLHHTLESGRYAQLPWLRWYWWALAMLAVVSWLGVYLWRPWWQSRRAYRLSRVSALAQKIWEVEISPLTGRSMKFAAGQFAWLKLGSLAPYQDHPFSISSVPEPSGQLRFIVKEAGDFTRALPNTVSNTMAYVDGPYGNFAIPASAPAIVMLAGGIGIAPFISLLTASVQQGERRPIRLVYAEHDVSQMVSLQALCACGQLADFQLLPMVESPPEGWIGLVGRLDATGLALALSHEAVAPLAAQAHYMVCGPGAMMDAAEACLLARGVAADRVQSEHFQYNFSGRSPRALALRRGWLGLSLAAGLLSLLVLALRSLRA
ncbi:MAG: ferric reductase-like transmembrane domain-containing protein [Hylemonella sp.]